MSRVLPDFEGIRELHAALRQGITELKKTPHRSGLYFREAGMRIFGLLAIVAILGSCGSRVSGVIAESCVESDRRAANARLCSCIQQVANRTLNGSDQRLAATFFENSERANDVKIDDSRSADAFWTRYRAFTRAAERSCR